jgi:hypothetical protein
VPFPDKEMTDAEINAGEDGLDFNCYVNHKIDDYFVKELESELKQHVPEIAQRIG